MSVSVCACAFVQMFIISVLSATYSLKSEKR